MADNLEDRLSTIISARRTFPKDYQALSSAIKELHGFAKMVAKEHPSRIDLLARIITVAENSKEHILFSKIPSGYDETLFHLRKQDLAEKLALTLSISTNTRSIEEPYHALLMTGPLRYDARQEKAAQLSSKIGTCTPFKNIPYLGIKTGKDTIRLMGELRSYASIDNIVHTGRITLPPLHRKNVRMKTEDRWNLAAIGAYDAQDTTRGNGATVAIIDTGVDYLHDELLGRFDPDDRGWNYVDNDDECMDKDGHGTHVSGTIAGRTVGVAPEATLKAFVVLDETGSGYEIDIMYALDDCITRGIHVVNMSLGSPSYNPAFAKLCETASEEGMLIAAAAGNDGDRSYNYPAAYKGVLAIAATDRDNAWLRFSNANDQVDLAAPGGDVYSCVPGGYAEYSGTSMASPHAAGSLALLRSLGSTPAIIAQAVQESAEGLPYSREKVGSGLVRPDLAMARLLMPA
jgi:hypothetical protein